MLRASRCTQYDSFIHPVGTVCSMNTHEPPARAIAELTAEINKPRFAASAVALNGYECSGCGCRFPETRAPKGRTPEESRRLEKIHIQREFAQHVCAERAWAPAAQGLIPAGR